MALFVALALAASASRASAGPIMEWLGLTENPPSSYPATRYWAPNVARFNDCVHGPRMDVYAPDRHPEITVGHDILAFPGAAPAQTLIVPPTPPATSTAR
jgi:hypothetical protein